MERDLAKAVDGVDLAVTRFPAEGKPWATMLDGAAMGVRQDFYAPIARFFAANGVHVLTFDYRGVGASRSGPLSRVDVDVHGWAFKDFNAMLSEARKPAPDLPLALLGHSLGGQILGIAPDNAAVKAVIGVTAGSGYYELQERMKHRVRFFWHVAVPVLTPVFGYFPGRALRMVGDLPKGVAYQWRRWCMHPDYLLSEGPASLAAYRRMDAPMLSYSFTDDEMMSADAVDSLNAFYTSSAITRRHVAPRDVGASRLGHFGYFSENRRDTLWKESLAWLQARLTSPP